MAERVQRVGMLGLGSMGGPMAANLAEKGFEVFGYDPSAAALERAAAAGVRGRGSPAEVASASEVTLAIPFDFGQVEQAVFGPNGVAEGLTGPGVFALMSTVGPENARALGRRLAERGHRLVDAPVSGGAAGAAAGTLTVMVGGADEDVERCRPAFEAFATNVFHVGREVGAGQAAKLANQLLVSAHLVATVEALTLGARSGVDPRQLHAILSTCAGSSRIFESRGAVIVDRSFKTGGTVNILVKDARLVIEAARAADAPLFMAGLTAQVLEMARAMGLGDEDDAALAKAYERILGEPIS